MGENYNSKNEKIYQAIIIGGGVGGLMAGRYLNNALILEKSEEIEKSFIRSGEGISSYALQRFKIKPDAKWISTSINTVRRISPEGKSYGRVKNNLGYIIDLREFKKFLVSLCLAEIKLGTEVVDLELKNGIWEVRTSGGLIFKSKFLIGADGVFSIVRRKIFKEKMKILPAIQYLIDFGEEIDTTVAKIYLDSKKFSEGYAWIFPKSKKSANIGIVGKDNLSNKLKDFLEETIRPKYKNFKILENKSGVIPYGGAYLKIFNKNALLVGDAAGLADPVFLGGINQAMWSGKIAADCLLKNESNLYEARVKSSPFADPRMLEAREIFYSFDNEIINDLVEVLDGKESSYLKTPLGIIGVLSKSSLRKNLLKLFKFFSIWRKRRKYLW